MGLKEIIMGDSSRQLPDVHNIADDAGKSYSEVSASSLAARPVSVCQFVVAGDAAGFAVQQAVIAQAHFELGLAQDAEFFAPTTLFHLFALGAYDALQARS